MRIIVALCICVLLAAAASAETITCPIAEPHTGITTTVASPWWQPHQRFRDDSTQQVWRLTGTSIETIAGRTTLVCKYWANATSTSVMRLPPKGETCKAMKTGFVCK
jgi:hypothetical protein